MAKWNARHARSVNVNVRVFQQGDVLIHSASIPPGAKAKADHILARGEATGHAHRLSDASDGLLYEAPDGTLYLRVGTSGATVMHEEHHPITLPLGDYHVRRVQEYDHFAEEARQVRD